MRIVKYCLYCSRDNYNVLPALLVKPVTDTEFDWVVVGARSWLDRTRLFRQKTEHKGFTIALKFWTFHAGIKVYYKRREI